MATPLTIRERLDRKLPRVIKAARQWARVAAAGRRPDTRVVFVVGSQRSGTRLPMELLDYAPEVASFSEGSAPFFRGVLLEPLDRVEALVRRSPAPVLALKPICETHRVHELLDRFPRSRAIWIFRHYTRAVSSASLKWTSGREAVRRLAEGELDRAGWRAGGLTPQRLELARRLYRPDMTLHEANAVMWLLRNGLFFDLHAASRPEILLVRYEDIVASPQARFGPVFDFIGLPPPPGFAAAVQAPERASRGFPEIAPAIRTLCDELHQRLLAHYTATLPAGRAEAS